MPDNPKTKFLTNDAITRKKWSKDLFARVKATNDYSYLVGTGTDAHVQLRTDLGKGEGDVVKFDIRRALTGAGRVGRQEVEGNEEQLLFDNFEMTIEELNHAVDTGGKMEEQRVPYNLMVEARDGLQEWWIEQISQVVINTLCGNSKFKINGETFAQACTEPTTNNHLTVNDVAEASLTGADVLDLTFLDRLKQRAENPTGGAFKLRPMKRNGKNYFRVLLHNYVFDQLRHNFDIGQWGDLVRAAGKLAMPEVEIEYNGMLISKTDRMYSPYTNVYRAVLMGAQAATFAWGGAGESKGTAMSFVPYMKDANRYVMVRGGGIFGCKKVVFNGHDYGVITGSSYATAIG